MSNFYLKNSCLNTFDLNFYKCYLVVEVQIKFSERNDKHLSKFYNVVKTLVDKFKSAK